MKRNLKRMTGIFICILLVLGNFLGTVGLAADTDVYELTFDNLFVFEQWANHPNLKVLNDATEASTITTDIEKGSFYLVNNSTDEIFTSFSMSTVGSHYNMPVEANTEYIFSYVANGTTTSFEAFVFYFDTAGNYTNLEQRNATQYGQNSWTFTTPANTGYIQVRFDNNSPQSNVTVSDIVIRETAVSEYAKDYSPRKTFAYSSGATYGALPVPARDGLVFAGWYTGPDGTGERITSSTAMTPSSKCLYSKWDPIVAGNLTVVSTPVKQEYCVGEALNTRGLVIGITYPDGTTENIDEGFSFEPKVLTATGTQAITVTYGGKSVQFTVDVKASESRTVTINSAQKTASVANNIYTLNYSGSPFNRYELTYSSDAYVKAEMNMGGVIEEFFLEPNNNGTFSGYIDGFLAGTTQTAITSITFTPLDKDYMSFTLDSLNLSEATNPAGSDGMVYLDGTSYKIGIDLDWGGALTYMEDKTNTVYSSVKKYGTKTTEVDFKSKVSTSSFSYNTSSSVNLINAHDTGRLVQQSYYGTGSYPYEPGMYGEAVWNYNPVQGGNLYNEASKIVDLKVTDNEIYIKCRPLDWAKEAKDITPSYMEAWYTLENGMMRATCRFVDYSGYPSVTTTQELPAFYCVEPLNDFVYFTGGDAWSDSNTQQTITDLGFWGTATDQTFICNENWGAFKGDDADSFAIGIYCPGQTNFYTGVYYGGDGATRCSTTSPATEDPTSYIGVVDTLYFQSYNPISYCYYITTGTIDTIRSSFKSVAQTESDICNATHTNGFCDMCGKQVEPSLTTNKYDLDDNGTPDAVYEIGTAGELMWFSDYVNNGNTGANAVLTNNITVNKNLLSDKAEIIGAIDHIWSPIGTAGNAYNGYFNGQGHTVSGLYYNSPDSQYGGLFGNVGSSATIREVGLTDSYIFADSFSGGIAGNNAGSIINCFTQRSFIAANTKAGGIAGANTNSIATCYTTAFSYAGNYVGAVCGYNTSDISNCYYAPNNAMTTTLNPQNGIGTASESSSMGDTDGMTTAKTLEEIYSGEVAYLLQKYNSTQVWGQMSNSKNSAPIFDYTGQYKVSVAENTDCYSVCFTGDILTDGTIDLDDYQQQVNMTVSQDYDTSDLKAMHRADLNADGVIDALDCSALALMCNGLKNGISVLPVGDFDLDGIMFSPEDVAAIKKGLINQGALSTRQKYACDLNSDGVLDINDRDILTLGTESFLTPICLDLSEQIDMRQTTANVIIIAGQSNAYGASPFTAAVGATVNNTDYSNIKIKYNNINSDDGTNNWRTHFSNSSFETFRPGIGGQAENWFGPELGLAHYLATTENTKDAKWYIIKYTAAGTYLGGNWIYDTNYNMAANAQNIYNDLGGYLSDLMIPYVNTALDEIASLHGADNINICSFMWHQGESDACIEQWANQYGDLEKTLVNKVRNAFTSRDNDANIRFIDGGIAAYKPDYNGWAYSDAVNQGKTSNSAIWYVPANTTGNVINKTTAGLYDNPAAGSALTNSIWIDTSTCLSKLENNNENGENDGAHYCGDSMLKIGIWYAQAATYDQTF